jgi:hypothetical protein
MPGWPITGWGPALHGWLSPVTTTLVAPNLSQVFKQVALHLPPVTELPENYQGLSTLGDLSNTAKMEGSS